MESERKIRNKTIRYKSRLYILVGFFFILMGLIIYSGKVIYNEYLDRKDNQKVEEFLDIQDDKDVDEIYFDTEVIEEIEDITTPADDNYIGVLEIPKINLKRGFLSIDNPDNTVSKNIQVIKESDMPDVENGLLIIAGHSGTGRLAFFKELHKLSDMDKVYVYYKNTKYTYTVIDKYEVEKTGRALIKRKKNITSLALITCNQEDKTKQIIYILRQDGRENLKDE